MEMEKSKPVAPHEKTERALNPLVENVNRLDSWKDIANYLDRTVRTVQRWETREAMPVHRQFHEKSGSVYAFKPEINAWRNSRSYHKRQKRDALPASPNVAKHVFNEREQLDLYKLLQMILVQLTAQPITQAVPVAPEARSHAADREIVACQEGSGGGRGNFDGNRVQSHTFLSSMQ